MTCVPTACAGCGATLLHSDRFCEACGAAVLGHTLPAGAMTATGSADRSGSAVCSCCGEQVADDYCTGCGLRPDGVTVDDRGALAYATHRGRRHDRNDDAAALGLTAEGYPVIVVADGVSTSPNPGRAARVATEAAIAALVGHSFTDASLPEAVRAARRATAQVPAQGDVTWAGPDDSAPACTLVVVVATPTTIHTINVGDARAYLVSGLAGCRVAMQLSVDDSLAADAIRGGADPSDALAAPGGHTITAWLGLDAPETEEHLLVRERDPSEAAAAVLACSDGLWNYTVDDRGLAVRLDAAESSVSEIEQSAVGLRCKALVEWANGQGGADNITVAMARL